MGAREVLKRYETEINRKDFDLLIPMVSTACTFWFSSGTYSGLEEARRAFEKTWRTIEDEVYWLTDVAWIAEGDCAAVCTYTFHWKGVIGGKPCDGQGRGTSCFRKEGDDWKLVHEHLRHFPR